MEMNEPNISRTVPPERRCGLCGKPTAPVRWTASRNRHASQQARDEDPQGAGAETQSGTALD